jgi:hypothetical protein
MEEMDRLLELEDRERDAGILPRHWLSSAAVDLKRPGRRLARRVP